VSIRLASLGLCLSVLVGCDSNGRAANAPTERAPATSAVLVPSAPPAGPVPAVDTAASTPPARPGPYPPEAIERARRAHAGKACQELVYKKGCAETRTGRVRVRLALGGDGKVEGVEIVDNGVERDPAVVEKCLKAKLTEWTFDPPDGAAPTVELELVFADKC
jgi:hypothetical protein